MSSYKKIDILLTYIESQIHLLDCTLKRRDEIHSFYTNLRNIRHKNFIEEKTVLEGEIDELYIKCIELSKENNRLKK